MLILTVVTGPDKGTVYRLPGDARIRIGRRHGDIPLNDKGASSKHAEINPSDGGWTLRDLDSSNGTYLNKERLDLPTAIGDGDRLQVGRSMLVFNVVDDAELTDEAAQDASPTAAIHAALAAQHRNQSLLAEIRELLESRPADASESTGDASAANDEIAALVRQVIDRLDTASASSTPVAPEPDVRIDDVLDQLRAIRQREVVVPPAAAPPEPVDLTPVLDAIESFKSNEAASHPVDLSPVIAKLNAIASAPPVDLAPLVEKLDELKTNQPTVDLRPVLDAIESIKQSQPTAPPVDLSPVLEKLDAIDAKPAPTPEATDLSPVLDAIAANRPSDTTERFDQLAEQIAKIQSALESTDDAPANDAIDLADLRDQLAAIRRGVELDRTGALTEKLDRIVEAIERTPDVPDAEQTFDPTEITERLGELRTKIDELSTAHLDAKVDQLLELATSPSETSPAPVDPALIEKLEQVLAAVRDAPKPEPADVGPIADKIAELRASVDALAEQSDAPTGESHDAAAALLPQIVERIDRMESALSAQATQTGDAAESAVGAIGERIEAIVDVLRAMPSATGGSDNDGSPAPSGIDEQLVAELNAKLEVIFESIQQERGERAAASGEIDSLIDMLRNEHTSTDTEAALSKVIARLDRMEQPAPALDAELLERLEKVSLKLDNLQISGFDIPDPTPLLADTIEPLLRQIHDKVTHGEAVDLRGTEQRIAELAESVRDTVNHSDRPLLEQILVEVRESAGGGPDGAGDKLELILERVSRLDDLKELEPLLHQVKDAASLGSNDKVIALLRQLIEHVQTMPSKFDGKETIDNVFQSLRRLEQQQEQQATTLRRLVASVAESEERLSRAVATNPPARQSMRFTPSAPAAMPAPAAPRGETDIDPEIESMLAASDPTSRTRPRGKRSLLLTIALVVGIPLLGVITVMNWNEIKNFRWFDNSPSTPNNGTNRATPDQPETDVTRR